MVHQGKLPARTMAELMAAGRRFPKRAPRSARRASRCRSGGTAGSSLPYMMNVGMTIILYEGLYHEILNEPERDTVLDGLCVRLDAHVGAVVA
jgi:alpha-beta hydrolase superfamily lysophospholipase